jgi:Fe2+ or Zn2+ uptake regulation protein
MKTHYYTDDIINICTDKHLTVDQIFNFLQEKYPEIGRSSIYRNVEQLSEK